jgi:L-rhamnose mutarotase
MKIATALVAGLLVFAMAGASGAEKSYTEGQVTELSFIKIKPGKFDEYMKYLSTTYKTIMEANKKAGLITGYGVYAAQPRSPQEPDLILSIVYPNMAALDKIAEAEAISEKIVGDPAAQAKGAVDREAMREVLGSEMIRELVLK